MSIRTHRSPGAPLLPSEITPRESWLGRRQILNLAATAGLGRISLASAQGESGTTRPGKLAPLPSLRSVLPGGHTMEPPTPYADVVAYNNFYEFGTDKADPARLAHRMRTRPWTLQIDGLVKKPLTLGLEDLLKLAAMEDRIYRFRCVEGWSMVIPWVGYSLAALLKRVEPLGSAKYVEFVSVADASSMPGLHSGVLDWPYVEGLRLDEAMHPLTLLAFGLYGEILPNQNGAPLRLVVPWKYGFKSAKSIVRIRLVENQPATAWNRAAPNEYGFYSNVNPDVAHPRWSQATERRIGDAGGLLARRRKTLLFNGYASEVASLYAGMDLQRHY